MNMKRTICGLLTLVLFGCQSTGLYSKEFFTSVPAKGEFKSDVHYAAALGIYYFPRKCSWVNTADGLRTSEAVQYPSRFTGSSIIKNKVDDGTYLIYMSDSKESLGEIPLYVNVHTRNGTCWRSDGFETGEFYDFSNHAPKLPK